MEMFLDSRDIMIFLYTSSKSLWILFNFITHIHPEYFDQVNLQIVFGETTPVTAWKYNFLSRIKNHKK